ncbi:PEP-CTERM sorting domain-containing protein [Luteolibacter pohnpeiensis]|uniref:PEP-CTERM sorting domain-containing protein n=1 Tax=Luteolibacter pohnpeiensis TaxID=454153 RepID=A0A934VW94_9BACT|nr:PEP-CTERM sorting domain-containing protein [Luteolibacter pohnpeiensis]MBK1882259.1 PEP-CTERM sorting domain-containing protein [Luteolibacter pohnpeiensis]
MSCHTNLDMKPYLKNLICLSALLGATSAAHAGTIVPDLDDSLAIYSQSTANTTTTGTVTLSQGVTLAAQFTANASDLLNSTTGAVSVIEIGGTTSGTGLYIIDGYLWLLGSSTTATTAPSSSSDVDASDNSIGVQLGAVTAGVQSTIFASLNTTNGTLLISQDSIVTTFALSGITSSWNWAGNRTASFGIADATVVNGNNGYRGGLVDAASNPLFNSNNAYSLTGDLTLGQVFNTVSSVPEPSVPALLGAAVTGFMLFGRNRRSRNA